MQNGSKNKYNEMDELIKLYLPSLWIAGSIDNEIVSLAEKRLGLKFPPSYKYFVLSYGTVDFEGEVFYGLLPDYNLSTHPVILSAETYREEYNLPLTLLPVYKFDYEVYALDVAPNHDGECSVIAIRLETSGTGDTYKVANNFNEFFVKCFRELTG